MNIRIWKAKWQDADGTWYADDSFRQEKDARELIANKLNGEVEEMFYPAHEWGSS